MIQHFSLFIFSLLMSQQKLFSLLLTPAASLNSSWTLAFLTPSIHAQTMFLTVLLRSLSLLPPSVYCLFKSHYQKWNLTMGGRKLAVSAGPPWNPVFHLLNTFFLLFFFFLNTTEQSWKLITDRSWRLHSLTASDTFHTFQPYEQFSIKLHGYVFWYYWIWSSCFVECTI